MEEFLSSAALNPGSIGPTLPPMQPFQFPTGPTGATGATGITGPTGPTGPTGSSLSFTPLAPNPTPIALSPNTNNITIMEVFVPIEKTNDQVLLNATIGTELHVQTGATGASSFNADAINYQLFRDNLLLTNTLVSRHPFIKTYLSCQRACLYAYSFFLAMK
ncbi:exosporium leader peptide-containing protein [Bacillus cereus]|uniref:exosporium leader peptide-containing protein n=1 Tax=Bacillus cereus TaxID=1396 RepID=UPI0025B0A771|nr:exosporium leader peptide-containing protein [Bacillus cereus]WJX07301.1 exosporium leader peptide-containing protein [Bacillus cereus]